MTTMRTRTRRVTMTTTMTTMTRTTARTSQRRRRRRTRRGRAAVTRRAEAKVPAVTRSRKENASSSRSKDDVIVVSQEWKLVELHRAEELECSESSARPRQWRSCAESVLTREARKRPAGISRRLWPPSLRGLADVDDCWDLLQSSNFKERW